MKPVCVRTLRIGEGRVKICVPLTAKTKQALLQEAQAVGESKAQAAEWRLDLYEESIEENTLSDLLRALRYQLQDKVLLVTIRTQKEGGGFTAENERYRQIYKWVIDSNLADLIDVEASMTNDVREALLTRAHAKDMAVIISAHDFHHTPAKETMVTMLLRMQKMGGDIVKLAVMPKDAEDVLALLAATAQVYQMQRTPLITMAMGALGAISRLSGEVFGSAMTFATLGASSAPGQLPLDVVAQTLDLLHAGLVTKQGSGACEMVEKIVK